MHHRYARRRSRRSRIWRSDLSAECGEKLVADSSLPLPRATNSERDIYPMKTKASILCMLVVSILCSTIALAQEGAAERDPFHPSEGRIAPAVTTRKDDPWGKDPFDNRLGGKVLVQKKEPGHSARGKGLTGIIYSSDARLAIIGGEVLRE